MSQTIGGTYKNGVVVLDHPPRGVNESRVVVEFVDEAAETGQRGALKFGMFAKPARPFTSDEDIDAVKKSWNRGMPFDGLVELIPVRPIQSMRGFLSGMDNSIERDDEDRL
jgi:hypothetical protein